MKKILVPLLGAAALLFLVFIFGRPPIDRGAGPTALPPQNSAAAAGDSFDFGKISMKAGKVSHVFTVSAPSTTPLTIARIATSCMCTTAYLIEPDGRRQGPFGMEGMGGTFAAPVSSEIAPGESLSIEAIFDPAAHGPAGVGAISRFVSVTDSLHSTRRFEVRAIVTP